MQLVLASASPARLRLLRAAGIDPVVIVSNVDESGATGTVPQMVAMLAGRKALAVADRSDLPSKALVIGCDSLLDVDGDAFGKPASRADASQLWRQLRGRSAVLHTGHHLIDVESGRSAAEVTSTVVRFADLSDDEVDAYVGSGEPLAVAGAFTLDGLGSAWIDDIDGDPSTVIGLSVPALRRLLDGLGRSIVDLWV
jgi:nucleoside triphosphate pyrophosphatase